MNNKILSGLIIALLMVLGFSIGCKKDVTVVIDNGAAAVANKTISFSGDIVPILSKSCSITGCHVSGGQAPDLSAAKAYSSLTGGFVNTSKPESSKVYLSLTGKGAMTMPVGSANNPSNLNNLMLTWIKQGAKNN